MSALGSRLLDSVVTTGNYLELQERLDALDSELDELRRRDDAWTLSFQQLDQQLRLASQVQRDLLPQRPPEIRAGRIHTLFHPAEHVSGDIYNLARLDESTVCLALADATGHGIAAALLTVFIKQGLRGKETYDGCYRILSPADVLERLNVDLLETNLSDGQFVTAVYAVFDEQERTLTWGRAGAPHPILVRRGAEPRLLSSAGTLLGAVANSKYETASMVMRPGDTVLLYTDGLEALLVPKQSRHHPRGLQGTPWFAELGERPIEKSLDEIRTRLTTLDPHDWPVDDVTVVALSMTQP
ncbi:MAG TPA: PP2C family protein-serine/threonine phosphatase [Phycisphaerae bacterium]